jgi:Zn-dependent protease with chaperone function
MRLWVILGLASAACVLPLAGASVMRREGSPRQIIAFSLASLAAIAAALIVGLGAIIDPGALPVGDLPSLLGRCIDAAGRILEHPVRHWPRIVAAFLLVAVIVRLLWSWFVSIREARSRLRIVDAIGLHAPSADLGDLDVLVVPAEEPFAFTVGLRRRRVVVSRPVLTQLGQGELAAVLAHERAHVQAWHFALLTLGTGVSRAFPFIPPLRACADQLVVGLEMAADQAAARAVRDPLIVARALLALAPHAPHAPHASMRLGVAETAIHDRVERLMRSADRRIRPGRRRAGVLLLSIMTLSAVLLFALPASARAFTADGRALALHASCDLPPGV